jgi:hypothetical protein
VAASIPQVAASIPQVAEWHQGIATCISISASCIFISASCILISATCGIKVAELTSGHMIPVGFRTYQSNERNMLGAKDQGIMYNCNTVHSR